MHACTFNSDCPSYCNCSGTCVGYSVREVCEPILCDYCSQCVELFREYCNTGSDCNCGWTGCTQVPFLGYCYYSESCTNNCFGTNFSSSPTSIVSLSPTSDSSSPYITTLTGLNLGTTTITANVVMSGSVIS